MSTGDYPSVEAFVRFMRKHMEETVTYHPETGCLVCPGDPEAIDMVGALRELSAMTGIPSKDEVDAEEKAERRTELQAKLERVPEAWPKERAMVQAEIDAFERENLKP